MVRRDNNNTGPVGCGLWVVPGGKAGGGSWGELGAAVAVLSCDSDSDSSFGGGGAAGSGSGRCCGAAAEMTKLPRSEPPGYRVGCSDAPA